MTEKTVTDVGEKKRNILEQGIRIREVSIPTFEIDMPGSVLVTLDVDPSEGRIQFVEENGRVYLEKA